MRRKRKRVTFLLFEDEEKEEHGVYGSLDADFTLLIHGLESDWIEEEMADDDDFR